jgi:HEAT repeats
MTRILCISAVALVGLASSAPAGPFACLNHGVTCITPPADCPDCSGPCERWRHCSCRKSEKAQKLIEQLSAECCCDRIRAASHLGHRLHADFCCDPEILPALIHALQCDPCWEVRKAAAWSIAYQGARTEEGVMALYLATLLDPHFLVRDAANDALGILIVCRRECFKDVFAAADDLAAKLKGKYKPGAPDCGILFDACQSFGHPVPPAKPKVMPEALPAPLPKGAAALNINETTAPRVTTAPLPN